MRKTIVDVAQVAGVSTATVDRVLNGRAGVRGATRDRVFAAARSVGYLMLDVNGTPPTTETKRIDVVVPLGSNTYMSNLAEQLERHAELRPGLALRLHRIEGFNAEKLAETLQELDGQTTAIALVGLDHPVVREAIRDIGSRGVRIVTLASDIHNVPRAAYVGIDNRVAGRLSGLLLGRLMRGDGPKRVALLAGSRSYRAHEEREMGCKSILSDEFSNISVVDTIEVRDDMETSHRATTELLSRYPELDGIYSMGAGNRGVAAAVREQSVGDKVIVIAHELTRHSREYLLDGTFDVVLDQHPRIQARDTIQFLTKPDSDPPPPIRLGVIFKENIPD